MVEEYNLVCFQDETLLRQKARVDWLKSGDNNTKFFHNVLRGRKYKKNILMLKKDEDTWCEDVKDLKNIVVGFFENIYKDDSVIGTYSLKSEENLGLNNQEHIMLSKKVSAAEVKMAFFTMNPNKSPRVDGYPISFFQKAWNVNVVGRDFTLCY